ncbi:MAG: MBL fold metallo-hydrolase [Firmicutes bacterium]|nr:MBL fold metallo-hydrolase [Bacillota bacterium]
MARFFPLFSGSSGNSMYFGSGDGGILIDIGMSAKKTAAALQSAGIAPESLGGIFITHEHIDHVSGLRVFLKRYPIPVYASAGTCSALREQGLLPESAELNVLGAAGTQAAGIQVRPFHTSHDCREGYGYVMSMPDGRTAALSTDLGYLSEEVLDAVSGCDLVVMESNHDVRMLQNGSYPYPLKRRILSDIGHLSNESCAGILPELIRTGSTRFVLAHLSRENNLPELALATSRAELQLHGMRENLDYSLAVAPRENHSGHISIF